MKSKCSLNRCRLEHRSRRMNEPIKKRSKMTSKVNININIYIIESFIVSPRFLRRLGWKDDINRQTYEITEQDKANYEQQRKHQAQVK
jgi:hypothetical protein